MILRAMIAAILVAAAGSASAQTGRTQLEANVDTQIDQYVQGVDVSTLSTAQLGQIFSIMHSNRSESDKRGLIRSALGGRYSLRSLFFN